MAQSNASILSHLWTEGTNDYQQRVPRPDVATQAQTAAAIFDPANNQVYNQFVDGLVNRIGMTYARQQSWRNPLAVFKRGPLPFGSSVQELQAAWVAAHAYSDEAQTLLKVHRPEVRAVYHELNREDSYKLTVNRVELRRAFVDEYGLNNTIAAIMESPLNSERYDEYRQMLQLISYYDNAWGFFKIHADEPDDDASAKSFLKSLKAMVERLAFPSALYNAQILGNDDDAAFPVFARPEELVLLVTPEASASIDVDALATLFHLEPADARVRKVIVDEFPIPGAFAMLTTEDWFQVYDIEYSNGSFYNPETLNTSYFLTVMQVISCSPFVPAIIWTTEAGTQTGTITQTVTTNRVDTGIFTADALTGAKALVGTNSATVAGEDVLAGRVFVRGIQLAGSLSDGTVTGAERIGAISVRPDAAVLTVTGAVAGEGTVVATNSRTRVDRLGKLHLQADLRRALASGNVVVTLSAMPTYVNPSGSTPTPQATTVTVTISQLTGGGQPGPGPEPPAPLEVTFYVNGSAVTDGFSETVTETSLELTASGSALSDSATAVATVGGVDHAMTLTSGPGGNSYVYAAEYAGAETAITISVTDGGASASVSGTVSGS